MRIAIIHYHLQQGGVTRIIENGIKACASPDLALVVLTGQKPQPGWPSDYRVIPGLQYEALRPPLSPPELARELEQSAREALGGVPDVWHVHNHCLGKNLALPGALRELADKGQHLLLHIHDFAEDGRPANYQRMLGQLAGGEPAVLAPLLYPAARHVHYAVLNGRDHDFLLQAGLDSTCLHRLPNPVQLNEEAPLPAPRPPTGDVGAEQLWLYPTRAIRRKNIAEFLLWAALAAPGTRFATTLAPQNPLEQPRYERWKEIATELQLPVSFDLAAQVPDGFMGLFRRATGVLTTSISEGFGMAFLEPWLVGKAVSGRDLPEVTSEFRDEGIVLPSLYERLDVPVHWLGLAQIVTRARAGLARNLAAYGRTPKADHLERVLATWIRDEGVDFGRLDEELQEAVLRRVVRRRAEVAQMLTPAALPPPCREPAVLQTNREILAQRYGLPIYGARVRSIYERLAASATSPVTALDGEKLLDLFLEPERLALLRVD